MNVAIIHGIPSVQYAGTILLGFMTREAQLVGSHKLCYLPQAAAAEFNAP
jgi:hypothetical protein